MNKENKPALVYPWNNFIKSQIVLHIILQNFIFRNSLNMVTMVNAYESLDIKTSYYIF